MAVIETVFAMMMIVNGSMDGFMKTEGLSHCLKVKRESERNFNVITIYNKEKLYREEVNKQHPKDVVFINNNGPINTSINESAKAIWNLI